MTDLDLLNTSLAGEFFGVAAYEAAIGSRLLDDGTVAVAQAFQADHQAHADRIAELITERGGTCVTPLSAEEYAQEFPPLNSAADVIAYAIELESGAAAADIASIASYQDASLAVVIAQIAGVKHNTGPRYSRQQVSHQFQQPSSLCQQHDHNCLSALFHFDSSDAERCSQLGCD